jgi:hypothetical protein
MPSEALPPTTDEAAIKAAELEVRRLEAAKAIATITSPWWRRADPIVLAILAGVLTLFGNMTVTILNNYNVAVQEQKKASDDLALEQAKARYNLVLQAMATNDAAVARRNIHFFIDAGLLNDPDCRIRDAIDQDQPVLPSLSGVAPPLPGGLHSASEIAALYKFPGGFDGRGVTVGILELGGSVIPGDIDMYFKSLGLPPPDIASVAVDGANYQPGTDVDGEVMINVEIIGAIAPRARIRVYFAPNEGGGAAGFEHTIQQAVADGVNVLSIAWGGPEANWKDEDIARIEAALEQAAKNNMTVVAAAGDNGVTDGMTDGHRHVDFPAASEWVLAVGGTALKSDNGRIISETVWKSGDAATGGGISQKIDGPVWQSALSMPNRDDGKPGRGIPDVVASAAPELGVSLIVHGKPAVFGGTSEAVPLWAGLIALIDQAVGYSVGYLNPSLYQNIGPEHLLNAITSGNNSIGGVTGYTAGPGWSPVAGWGSPDGVKLLNWLRDHPSPPAGKQAAVAGCQPSRTTEQLVKAP